MTKEVAWFSPHSCQIFVKVANNLHWADIHCRAHIYSKPNTFILVANYSSILLSHSTIFHASVHVPLGGGRYCDWSKKYSTYRFCFGLLIFRRGGWGVWLSFRPCGMILMINYCALNLFFVLRSVCCHEKLAMCRQTHSIVFCEDRLIK